MAANLAAAGADYALVAAEPPRLSGQWQGPLKVPGGTLTLVVTIVPLSTGTYYAALDVPQQHISRMPVEVEVKDDNLVLRIDAPIYFTNASYLRER